MRTWGLEKYPLSNREKFREAMSDLRVIALEDENSCRAVTNKELESFEKVWSVDSRLVQNLEGICGILGIDLPAADIIKGLGKAIQPAIPLPRILGRSKSPLADREVSKICIYQDERSYRIDICWEKKKPGRWTMVPDDLRDQHLRHVITINDEDLESVWITSDAEISSECKDYDMVIWRRWCLIFATSPICDLLEIFGMNERFVGWLGTLLQHGEIPVGDRPLLKQHLAEAKHPKSEELLARLVLPFERRFGDVSRTGLRGAHIFLNNW